MTHEPDRPLDCQSARGVMIDAALGQAEAARAAGAQRHVDSCAECQREVEALTATITLLRRQPAPSVSRQFRPRLSAALDAVDRGRATPLRVLPGSEVVRRRWVAAAAALPLLIGLGWYVFRQSRECEDVTIPVDGTRLTFKDRRTPGPDVPFDPPAPGDRNPVETDPNWPQPLVDDVDAETRRRELVHLPPDAPKRRPTDPSAVVSPPPNVPEGPIGSSKPSVARATPVERALDWLARNQRPDGSWTPGPGETGIDTGVTGIVLLAFVSHGHLGRGDGPLDVAAARASAWLFAQQDLGEGRFRGGRDAPAATFCHAAASLALVEQHVRALAAGSLDAATAREQHDRLERALTVLENDLDRLFSDGARESRCGGQNAAWTSLALSTARHCGVDFHLKPSSDRLVQQIVARLRSEQPALMLATSQAILTMAERDPKPIAPEELQWARAVNDVLEHPERVEPSLRFLVASALFGQRDWSSFEATLAKRLLAMQSAEYGYFDSGILWDCFAGGTVSDTALAVLALSVRERHDEWAAARARLESEPHPKRPK